jgi:hypothetical protein
VPCLPPTPEILFHLIQSRLTHTFNTQHLEQVGHGSMTSISHQPRILGQHAPGNRHIGRLPLPEPCVNLLSAKIHIDPILLRICIIVSYNHIISLVASHTNRNNIAIPHDGNRPAHRSLRTNMPNDKPVAGATVPAVSNECDIGEFRAHDGCAGFQLLGHARAAFGAFVAHDYDDVFAVRNQAGVEGGVEFVFFVEDLWGGG